jgi:hypothetical protein
MYVSLLDTNDKFIFVKYHGLAPNTTFRQWTSKKDDIKTNDLYISSDLSTVKLKNEK